MPLSTYVGRSEMTEVVPTEKISKAIAEYEYEPTVSESIAWIEGGTGNVPVRFARWNALTVPAGTVNETVDHTDVNVDLAESSITPGVVRFRLPISREVAVEAQTGIPAGALTAGLDACRDRMDIDALSSSTSATTAVGAVGTAFTLAEFHVARQAYRAMNIPGSLHALVLHGDALDSLENSIRNQSGPWAILPNERLATAVGSAFQGRMNGLQIFKSDRIPDESTGHSNFITPMGMGQSGLGVVMNQMPTVEVSNGDEAHLRFSLFYHFYMWYGTGLTNPRRFLEVLSA